jgi:hypothetical protein
MLFVLEPQSTPKAAQLAYASSARELRASIVELFRLSPADARVLHFYRKSCRTEV